MFDCCGLFEEEGDLRHEPLTNSLIVDPLQGVIGILCAVVLLSVFPRAVPQNISPATTFMFLIVFTILALSGLYTYEVDDVEVGYAIFVVVSMVCAAIVESAPVTYAHNAVLLILPLVFENELLGTWIAALVSLAFSAAAKIGL